jgi:glycosyltransferase involved in cell wall biosynthesis
MFMGGFNLPYYMTKFLIIASGYNCAHRVKPCIDSVKAQTYEDWTAVFIDDASQDDTFEEIYINADRDNMLRVQSTINMGAAWHRYHTIRNHPTTLDTVVVLLGLDDELTPDALQRISKEYRRGAFMTYGNWKGSDGYLLPEGFLHYTDPIHRSRYYRSVTYRATACNTFYAWIFEKHFKEDDFKHGGEWIKATTESNLMLSLLEMCGKDRIGVIEDIIYLYYNNRKDSASRRFGRAYQDEIYKSVKKKPIRPLL